MKHYFNKFNIFNILVGLLLITGVTERLTSFLFVEMELVQYTSIALTLLGLRVLFFLWLISIIIFVFYEFIWRITLLEMEDLRNSATSYLATWRIRRYCIQINVEPTLDESLNYYHSKQLIVKKANRSLRTLTVTFYNDKAIAIWQLPPNSESYALMEELLPEVKRELNQFDENYRFNDFIRLTNGRLFISEATRLK